MPPTVFEFWCFDGFNREIFTGGLTGICWALMGTGHLVTSEQAGRQSEQSAG